MECSKVQKKVECAAIGGFGGSLPRLATIPTCRRSGILEFRVLIPRTSQHPDRREFGTAKFPPPSEIPETFPRILQSSAGPSSISQNLRNPPKPLRNPASSRTVLRNPLLNPASPARSCQTPSKSRESGEIQPNPF